jgi:transposase
MLWSTIYWRKEPVSGRLAGTSAGSIKPSLSMPGPRQASSLDRFKPYLSERIASGCLKASVLHREVVAQGFTGSYSIVRRFVEQHRARPDLRAIPKPLSIRQVTGWICRHPDNLPDRDTERLTAILTSCPDLKAASELVRSFAAIMTQRHGHRLGEWLGSAEQADLPGIKRFVGVNADLDAVTAGLSLPFSSGPVEGNVNRIKMLKGRCMAEPASTCSANAFSCPADSTKVRPANTLAGAR